MTCGCGREFEERHYECKITSRSGFTSVFIVKPDGKPRVPHHAVPLDRARTLESYHVCLRCDLVFTATMSNGGNLTIDTHLPEHMTWAQIGKLRECNQLYRRYRTSNAEANRERLAAWGEVAASKEAGTEAAGQPPTANMPTEGVRVHGSSEQLPA